MGSSASQATRSCKDDPLHPPSPINLPALSEDQRRAERPPEPTTDEAYIRFKYGGPAQQMLVNLSSNSSVIELVAPETSSSGPYVLYQGQRYQLTHIQVCTPSEHSFDHMKFPLELQLYHRNKETGENVVVAFVVRVCDGDSPPAHPERKEMLERLLRDALEQKRVDVELGAIINKTHTGFYFYQGSIIGNSCETAKWIVFNRPIGLPEDVVRAYVQHVARSTEEHSRPEPAMRMEQQHVVYVPGIGLVSPSQEIELGGCEAMDDVPVVNAGLDTARPGAGAATVDDAQDSGVEWLEQLPSSQGGRQAIL